MPGSVYYGQNLLSNCCKQRKSGVDTVIDHGHGETSMLMLIAQGVQCDEECILT